MKHPQTPPESLCGQSHGPDASLAPLLLCQYRTELLLLNYSSCSFKNSLTSKGALGRRVLITSFVSLGKEKFQPPA
ncbi:uncharacterized [Tachysurus ichikawai]